MASRSIGIRDPSHFASGPQAFKEGQIVLKVIMICVELELLSLPTLCFNNIKGKKILSAQKFLVFIGPKFTK